MTSPRKRAGNKDRRGTVLILIVFAAVTALCQTASHSGKVSGMIESSDGKGVPRVLVVLSSQGTGIEQMRTTSDDTGRYSFSGVPYGSYKLTASAQGYKDGNSKLVMMAVPALTIDFVLSALEREKTGMKEPTAEMGKAKRPLEFSPSGIRGTIAPSGYSTGLGSEETAQVARGVSKLGTDSFASFVPDAGVVDCARESILQRAVRDNPHAFAPNDELGLYYLGHREYARSVQYLQMARALSPSDEETSRNLALALLGSARDSDAIAILQSLNANHDDPALEKLLAIAYEKSGHRDSAIMSYRRSAALDGSPENQFDCGMGIIRLGAAEEARSLFVEAEQAHPESAKLSMGLGIAEDLLGHKPQAVQRFLHAVELDPEYTPPYSFLADLVVSVPQSGEETRKRLAEFVVAHPEDAEAHLDYALVLWGQRTSRASSGNNAETLMQLKKALAINPKLARAHFVLGEVYAEAGDLSNAEHELQEALALDDKNAAAHYRLAQVYRRDGHAELANTELQKFRSLHQEHEDDGTTQQMILLRTTPTREQEIPTANCSPDSK